MSSAYEGSDRRDQELYAVIDRAEHFLMPIRLRDEIERRLAADRTANVLAIEDQQCIVIAQGYFIVRRVGRYTSLR